MKNERNNKRGWRELWPYGSVAAGLAAGVAAVGLAVQSHAEQFDTTPLCAADGAQWIHTPPNMNAGPAANALKVEVDQIERGAVGLAVCDEGLTAEDIGTKRVIVRGIGDLCLVMSVMADRGRELKPEEKYQNILAVCAAPPDDTPHSPRTIIV